MCNKKKELTEAESRTVSDNQSLGRWEKWGDVGRKLELCRITNLKV